MELIKTKLYHTKDDLYYCLATNDKTGYQYAASAENPQAARQKAILWMRIIKEEDKIHKIKDAIKDIENNG